MRQWLDCVHCDWGRTPSSSREERRLAWRSHQQLWGVWNDPDLSHRAKTPKSPSESPLYIGLVVGEMMTTMILCHGHGNATGWRRRHLINWRGRVTRSSHAEKFLHETKKKAKIIDSSYLSLGLVGSFMFTRPIDYCLCTRGREKMKYEFSVSLKSNEKM